MLSKLRTFPQCTKTSCPLCIYAAVPLILTDTPHASFKRARHAFFCAWYCIFYYFFAHFSSIGQPIEFNGNEQECTKGTQNLVAPLWCEWSLTVQDRRRLPLYTWFRSPLFCCPGIVCLFVPVPSIRLGCQLCIRMQLLIDLMSWDWGYKYLQVP